MIPALPEPAFSECEVGTDCEGFPVRFDLFKRAQLERYARDYMAAMLGEPFGHFRAEPFGWTDCAEKDEGAIALYKIKGEE